MSARLKTTAIKENSPQAALAKKLYEEAFPRIERIDFSLLLACVKTSKAEFFAYSDSGTFVGFAFVLLPSKYAYLLFCATQAELRSRGYGAAVIKKLRRRYPDRILVLDIEPMSDTAANSEQRRRRYMFYYNNGFRDTGLLKTAKCLPPITPRAWRKADHSSAGRRILIACPMNPSPRTGCGSASLPELRIPMISFPWIGPETAVFFLS